MIIYNPKDTAVEFYYGGQRFEYRPLESRVVDEAMGEFILNRTRVGLVEFNSKEVKKEAIFDETDYTKMPWKELISRASKRGIFATGMKKESVIKSMENYDKERRVTPSTSS
jgi:DNA phosphorothioation-dependent restriction protein DptG